MSSLLYASVAFVPYPNIFEESILNFKNPMRMEILSIPIELNMERNKFIFLCILKQILLQ